MVKCFSTYDFEGVNKRVEKTVVDPYCVQLEDYENINDLVERAIRTKAPLKSVLPDKIDGAEYDSEKVINEWLTDAGIQQTEPQAEKASQSDVKDEQSEVKTADVLAPDGSAQSL